MAEVSERVRQAVMAVQQHWVDRELAGDVVGVLALCTDDVIWLPPNGPALRDKNSVAAWLAALPENRVRRIEITNVYIDSSGGLAYKVADFTTWLDTVGQASDEPVKGSHLWVLREVSPGEWRVAVVAWSIRNYIIEGYSLGR
jgi:ketosteroid isomerase-like protein